MATRRNTVWGFAEETNDAFPGMCLVQGMSEFRCVKVQSASKWSTPARLHETYVAMSMFFTDELRAQKQVVFITPVLRAAVK